MKIEYAVKTKEEIDIVAPLWEKLNEHHGSLSRYFAADYPARTWENRKKELLSEAAELRVDLASDTDTGEFVGYCVSSVTTDRLGEIDSIFIEADYRHCGIGDVLMKKVLNWMDGLSVKKKIIQVADGNEEVHTFYRRYGFFPRSTILMQISENDTSGS